MKRSSCTSATSKSRVSLYSTEILRSSDPAAHWGDSGEEPKFYLNLKINLNLHQTKRIEHSFHTPGKPSKKSPIFCFFVIQTHPVPQDHREAWPPIGALVFRFVRLSRNPFLVAHRASEAKSRHLLHLRGCANTLFSRLVPGKKCNLNVSVTGNFSANVKFNPIIKGVRQNKQTVSFFKKPVTTQLARLFNPYFFHPTGGWMKLLNLPFHLPV